MIYNVNTLQDLLYKDIADGNHQVITHEKGEDVTLQVEIKNYAEDFICNTSDSIGDSTPDERMLIVKFHKNLTIPSGITFRPSVRKRGMLILCLGVLRNDGIISMTERGARAVGQNIYVARNNNILINISATGGVGGQKAYVVGGGQAPGYRGQNGYNGIGKSSSVQITGGGGSGGTYSPWGWGIYSGGGAKGTSYSGGPGAGGDGSTLIIDRVTFSSFLLQVNNDIYTLNEDHYSSVYPTTLSELSIFKTTADPLTLTSDEINANATFNADNVVKIINILKENNINNIKLLKLDK